MNLLELRVTSNNILAYWEADKNREPYMGEMFFPNKRINGLKFDFVKGKQGVPVALVPANFNTNVLYRDRIGIDLIYGKLPFFKEASAVDEELRQEIKSTKEEFLAPLFDRIFDDKAELLDGAEVAVERMRFQLLSQGTISIQANGVDKQYDYGFSSSSQIKTLTTKWNDEGAKPLADIVAQVREYKKKFKKTAKYLVANESFVDYLIADTDIQNYFAKANIGYPSDAEVIRYVENRTGLTLLLNDKEYLNARDFKGTPVPFYPKDRFTLLSTLDLGETLYGTTPEEIDLANGDAGNDLLTVTVTEKGVAITTWKIPDPVNVNVKVSEVACPSCPQIDSIYIVKFL